MNNTLRLRVATPLIKFVAKSNRITNFDTIQYLDIFIDINELIDNHAYIVELINKQRDILEYQTCLEIGDWLFAWYKKVDQRILANRLLNSYRYVLSVGNDLRIYKL